ncbi:hypothetical protein E2C01_038303 [Portunus trituberculatus]|uniref:Uncharacterized protein n=1 Tax=Portunus trituberculatus TaxID=210409 RepID=A0A5B7FGW5_PORTR|nr:hypothetical protein [Portunus trituberculatus]
MNMTTKRATSTVTVKATLTHTGARFRYRQVEQLLKLLRYEILGFLIRSITDPPSPKERRNGFGCAQETALYAGAEMTAQVGTWCQGQPGVREGLSSVVRGVLVTVVRGGTSWALLLYTGECGERGAYLGACAARGPWRLALPGADVLPFEAVAVFAARSVLVRGTAATRGGRGRAGGTRRGRKAAPGLGGNCGGGLRGRTCRRWVRGPRAFGGDAA